MAGRHATRHPVISKRPVLAVLVADDEPKVQHLLSWQLHRHGFAPLRTSSVRDILAVAERQNVDAFLLDFDLDNAQAGLLVLRWLRAQPQYADTPVLILTGSRDLSEEEEALMRRHRADVFHKGQSPERLMDYLKCLLLDTNAH
jgi:DNA-binding response OmpR family regulator